MVKWPWMNMVEVPSLAPWIDFVQVLIWEPPVESGYVYMRST